MMAAALTALLRHMGRHVPATLPNGGDEETADEGEVPQTTVAVDGSMFLKYDKFKCAGWHSVPVFTYSAGAVQCSRICSLVSVALLLEAL